MGILNHITTRVYGIVTGVAPFENAAGAAAVSSFKAYPIAPMASVPTTGVTFWPLANGLQTVSGYYVYTIMEIPPTGLNQQPIKLATDQSVTNIISNAT